MRLIKQMVKQLGKKIQNVVFPDLTQVSDFVQKRRKFYPGERIRRIREDFHVPNYRHRTVSEICSEQS